MTITERLENFLAEEGFRPKRDDDNDLVFKFEGMTFVSPNNEEDEDYLQIMLPCIFEVTDDNKDTVLEAINTNTRNMKVVKTFYVNDQVWLTFEILMDQSPELDTIVPRGLRMLMDARQRFYEILDE